MAVTTRIKVCGITSVEDAHKAAIAGVDAIGLVFYEKSPRNVSIARAVEIAHSVPPFMSVVGLFVNAAESFMQTVLAEVPFSLLQFHGDESEQECHRWGERYIKAFRVRPGIPVSDMVKPYTSASGYLLDSYHKGIPGGTGESFDWKLIPTDLDKPVILAGGLNPDNAAQAIAQVRPYAIDVSSGVEAAPGIKDLETMNALIKAAGR
ncbi:N-(5'-phosphoribosyl)anthranilate isomerase [Endozoicomonas sp. (ex Bugula neritina AB1)]|nr:N-(5'-phosphoribosyl)anthranilate isomerase [Endozoicomonas sp. (ex Bugula neritina AB1)]